MKRGARRAHPSSAPPRQDVSIGQITVRNGRLLILPNNPEKLPLQFDLEQVVLEDFGFDRASTVPRAADEPEAARATSTAPARSVRGTSRSCA